MLKNSLWVAFGAVIGANLRYGVARFVGRVMPINFPVGTLIINVTGSLILGAFFVWARQHSYLNPGWRLVIAVGFCGGYTTFSGYAWETYDLMREGNWALGALNIVASNVLTLLAVLVGAWMASKWMTPVV